MLRCRRWTMGSSFAEICVRRTKGNPISPGAAHFTTRFSAKGNCSSNGKKVWCSICIPGFASTGCRDSPRRPHANNRNWWGAVLEFGPPESVQHRLPFTGTFPHRHGHLAAGRSGDSRERFAGDVHGRGNVPTRLNPASLRELELVVPFWKRKLDRPGGAVRRRCHPGAGAAGWV